MTLVEGRRHWLALAAIFVLAAALRLHDLGLRPLWLDEAFSVWFTDQSWHYLWTVVPTFETHPPFYYSLLKIWRGFAGSSEFDLRLLSTVFALLTFPLVYTCGRICGGVRDGRVVGLFAAFLFATLKLQIFYAQDARPYTGFVFAMAVALTGAAWLVRHPHEAETPLPRLSSRALLAFATLAVGLALLQWFQNLGIVFILPLGLFLVGWWAIARRANKALFVNLIVAVLLAVLIYSPFIPRFIQQSTAFKGGFWLAAPTFTYLISQSERLFGQSLDSMKPPLRLAVYILTIVPVVLLGLSRALRRPGEGDQRRAVILLLLAGSVGGWLVNLALTFTLQPVFMERTMLPVQIPWLILLAMLPFGFAGRARQAMLAVLIVVFSVGALEFWFLKTTPPNDAPRSWRKVVEIISSDPRAAHAPVLAEPNHAELPIGYYEKQLGVTLDLHPLPAPFPALGGTYSYPVGGRCVPAVTQSSVDDVMRRVGGQPQIWLVTHGRAVNAVGPDPIDPDNLVQQALLNRHYHGRTLLADRDAALILYSK